MNNSVADPHWGWWIVWYFYLGGTAAGAYFIASLVEFVGDERDRELGRIGYLLAAPLCAICGILLILDLSQPARFWHMLFDSETLLPHVKYWSPMSIGAWALLLFGFVSTISFLGAAAEVGVPGMARWRDVAGRLHGTAVGRLFDTLGTICGFFIASYTGALLTATNQPIWSDSNWIAPLFLASSATTGIAALQLAGRSWGRVALASHEKLERLDTCVLLLEGFMVIFFVASLRLEVTEFFSQWPLVLLLVGTFVGGICLPFLLRLVPKLPGSRLAIIAGSLVLAGGFVLRYSILSAAPAMLRSAHKERGAAASGAGVVRPSRPTKRPVSHGRSDQSAQRITEKLG